LSGLLGSTSPKYRTVKKKKKKTTDIFPFLWLTGNEKGLEPLINLQVSNHILNLLLLLPTKNKFEEGIMKPHHKFNQIFICIMKLNQVLIFSGVCAREPHHKLQRPKLSNPICLWNGTHFWWTLCGNIITNLICIYILSV